MDRLVFPLSRRLAAAAAACLALPLLLPGAAAAPLRAYEIEGTAQFNGGEPTLRAQLAWDNAGTFTIRLMDPVAGLVLHENRLGGSEVVTEIHDQPPCLQHTDFQGVSDSPVPPFLFFFIGGRQEEDLCNGGEHMKRVSGGYLAFQLLFEEQAFF